MSETINTPTAADLDAQIEADEAARNAPPPEEPKAEVVEESAQQPDESESEFEKRIARLAYEKRVAEKEQRRLREEVERLRGQREPLPKDEDVQRQVEERAAQIAAENAYNARSNAIYQAGIKEFPDFEAKLVNLRDIGGISPALVEACDEIGDAHKLIHYLARNLDEAEAVVKASPHRMGAMLGKIATKLAAPKPTTKAPPPIQPVTGRANSEVSIEDSVRQENMTMPIDEWMRKEDERWFNRRRRVAS